jgi:hypothetical protein
VHATSKVRKGTCSIKVHQGMCNIKGAHKPDEQRFYAAAGFQEDFCAVKAKLSLDQCEEAIWITINKGATLDNAKVHQGACNIKGAEAKQDFAFMLLEDFAQSKQSYCLTDVKKHNRLQQTKELNSCQHYELLLQERLIMHDDF